MENHMKTPHPNPYSTVSISREVYLQLLAVAGQTGFDKEDWEIAADAINDWVRRNSPDAIAMPATNGYQWKQLFLPNGTLLRTIFNGKNHHCLVEGDQILYEGRAVSPSGFVNAIGGIRRNAWKSLWILLPDTTTWKLADSLRTKKRPARARKMSPARAAQGAQLTVPVGSNDMDHSAQENSVVQPTTVVRSSIPSTATRSGHARGIGLHPNHPAETDAPRCVYPRDTRCSPRADQDPGSHIERSPSDHAAIEELMRETLVAFSRSLLAIEV
jgi:hypothetical protein